MIFYFLGRKTSRNAPPVAEFGDHREPDFWLPRSLDSQKPPTSTQLNIYTDHEGNTATTNTAPFMRMQRPSNVTTSNRASTAVVVNDSGSDSRNSPLVAPRNPNRAGLTDGNPRNDGGSPTSSGGILINPSNQILQPPSSGHEKWNLPRDNSFRHAHSNSQSSNTSTNPRQRNSMDLDTIDEDLQSMNVNNNVNNNTPAPLPDLCQDAHHSSLEKQGNNNQQQQQQQQSFQRHGSLPNTTVYLSGSENANQLTTVGRTAIV